MDPHTLNLIKTAVFTGLMIILSSCAGWIGLRIYQQACAPWRVTRWLKFRWWLQRKVSNHD
jgi:hypothetical protein